MKSNLPAALVMALLVASPSSAAPYETLGGPVGGGSTVASTFGIDLTVVGNNVVIAPGNVVGTADAVVSLDGANNGTAQIFSSNLALDDLSGNATIPFIADIDFEFVGVGIDIAAGPVAVTGGNFSVDSATLGALTLNSGVITLTGTALGNPVNETIDLAASPISVPFSDLGTSVLAGTADDSLAGVDVTAPGDEITVDWAGASSTFNVDLAGTTLPIGVTITGAGLSIGAIVIPEPSGGLFLATLAAGTCGVARRRRK